MPKFDTQITFDSETDDIAENRDIVAVVEARSASPRAADRDLDDLMREFGFDPGVDFQTR